MSSKLLLLVLLLTTSSHSEFDTEWWYYAGNLQSANGHHYGYELTFFRQANKQAPKSNSLWNPNQIYLAHLALSDIEGQEFEDFERLNRAGPGLAGAVWNGNWHVENGELQAIAPDFTLKLKLNPAKPSVENGAGGVDRKGPLKDEFSHYTSFTRLISKGTLTRNKQEVQLTGTSWMDHEYFNDVQDPDLKGWD